MAINFKVSGYRDPVEPIEKLMEKDD